MLLLELAVRSEQKIAKVIALIEESRRDNPLLPDRNDPGAETLSQPSDPGSVLDAIKQAQQTPNERRKRFSSAQLARRRRRPHLHG
jgi:uncharacterized membrane protein